MIFKIAGSRLNKIFYFLLFSNLYIVICSFVMAFHTAQLFSVPLKPAAIIFIISGTLASYSFHWMLPASHAVLSKRDTWSRNHRFILLILFAAGVTGAVFSIVELKDYLEKLLPLIIFTFLYSSGRLPKGPFKYLRKYFIGKTIYLALMWSLVTVYLPLAISITEWNASFTVMLISKFFFLFAICILFDLRDKEADTSLGIKSLITIISYGKIKILFYSSLLISLVLSLYLLYFGINALNLVILIIPIFITAVSYSKSTRTVSDTWYYFYLDGLMMLPGLLYITLLVLGLG